MNPDPLAPTPVTAPDRFRLPEVLRVEDVAAVLGVKPSAARKTLARGECGPFVRVGRRLYVRRDAFLAALAAREVRPVPPPAPPPTPAPPDPALVERLRRPLRLCRKPRPLTPGGTP